MVLHMPLRATDLTAGLLAGCRREASRLASPVYGPALMLMLAACHRSDHFGPKPSTGSASTPAAEAAPGPQTAPTIQALQGQEQRTQ